MDLVIIDGPNLFNTVASRLDVDQTVLTLYLEECFDMDLLALASLGLGFGAFGSDAHPRMGIVIFHSRKPLGRGSYYLSDRKTEAFWARQGCNPDTSTFAVDIPGDQQDTFTFECSKCRHINEVTTRAEKGIDTSITTYLMETLDSWQSACLFSRDADYAPLVAALRRKGKIVYVAVPAEERSTALVRVAQSTIPLNIGFVRRDVAVARYLMPGGILDELVSTLAGHDDLAFAVDVKAEASLSLGITHPRDAASRVQEVMVAHLAKLNPLAHPIQIDQRNDRLLILKLNRDESVERKLGGFSAAAMWRQRSGDVHELYRKVVGLGK